MTIRNAKLSLAAFLGVLFIGFALFSFAEENSTSNQNIFNDADQDGLSDSEEKIYGTDPYNSDSDGDGYSDGTEVKSGYNPLKPAPGDKIVSSDNQDPTKTVQGIETTNTKNLTTELSGQVSTLISNKSENNETISIEDLDKLISESSASKITFDDLPEIDEKTIKIKEQDYSDLSESERETKEKEDAQEYLTAVSYILANNSPIEIKNTEDLEGLVNEFINQINSFSESFSNVKYFENLAEKGSAMLKELNDIEVPEKLVDLHIQGLQLANYSISLKDKYEIDSNDPISGILALSESQSLLTLVQEFVNDAEAKFTEFGMESLFSLSETEEDETE